MRAEASAKRRSQFGGSSRGLAVWQPFRSRDDLLQSIICNAGINKLLITVRGLFPGRGPSNIRAGVCGRGDAGVVAVQPAIGPEPQRAVRLRTVHYRVCSAAQLSAGQLQSHAEDGV